MTYFLFGRGIPEAREAQGVVFQQPVVALRASASSHFSGAALEATLKLYPCARLLPAVFIYPRDPLVLVTLIGKRVPRGTS